MLLEKLAEGYGGRIWLAKASAGQTDQAGLFEPGSERDHFKNLRSETARLWAVRLKPTADPS